MIMCQTFVLHASPRITPKHLSNLCQLRIHQMIRSYPTTDDMKMKHCLMEGLRNLLDVPNQFVAEFVDNLIEALQVKPVKDCKNVFAPRDMFLLSQLLHPSVTSINMVKIPSALRNIIIRNIHKLSGLRSLTLDLSLEMAWSTFFSQSQTSRFVSAIAHLQSLTFHSFADDDFLSMLGHH